MSTQRERFPLHPAVFNQAAGRPPWGDGPTLRVERPVRVRQGGLADINSTRIRSMATQQHLLPTVELGILEACEPQLLLRAIATVIADFYQNRQEPGSERWLRCKRHRDRLMDRIWDTWAELADADGVSLPWSEDYVLSVWVAFRKLRPHEKRRAWEAFGISVPAKFLGDEA